MKSESVGLPDTPKVSSATEKLLSVLRDGEFDYALVGGLAVVLQGYDRYTRDVDALVWNLDDHLEQFVELSNIRGLRLAPSATPAAALSARILHLVSGEGTAVDVLLGFLPFEREIIDRAETISIEDGLSALVATPEDLIIMKLIASRTRDLYDVMALVELYPDVDRVRIRRVVTEYAELLERPEVLKALRDQIK